MLFTSDSGLASCCLSIARAFLYPSYVSFNWLMCLYITTFQEEKNPTSILLRKIFLTPVYASIFIILLPIMAIFLPIRCALLYFRRPFMCSEHHTPYTEWQDKVLKDAITSGLHKFGVASANLCLMPELASKMNHLTNVSYRAEEIGKKIIASQFFGSEWEKELMEVKRIICDSKPDGNDSKANGPVDSGGDNIKQRQERRKVCLEGDVSLDFPTVDVFVIQEAWSSYQNKLLIKQLHKVFPYIVHDAGVHSYKNNAFFLNSGLLIASKHPIVAVDFKPFSNFVKHGRLLSNGLLMTQLVLGSSKPDTRYVGYVFNTHLQSYQGKDQIIPKQLDEMLSWIRQFKAENTKARDHELFCLLCGDFNFDNFSPADRESSLHPVFTEFSDFCRVQANLDKSWTVGTELRPEFMLDNIVSTPEGLKQVLEDPALRQCHLVDADIVEHCKEAIVTGSVKKDDQGNVVLFPEGGRRRIDYILSSSSNPLNIEGFHFVTKLASLTDHIPVAMEFMCTIPH